MLPKTIYHQMPAENDLTDKLKGLSQIGLAMSFLRFTKNGVSQKLLHRLKYRNKPEIAVKLGNLYGQTLNKSGLYTNWDILIPVPLHELKHKRRGYNQSEEFGRGLGESMSLPLRLSLKRAKFTETQTKKSRIQRLDNVEGVFELKPGQSVSGLRVLLVDDVMTTGATLCACANVLLANGAKMVDLVTIAAGK
ncbi:ComF family protein [Algoriphagus machipongonensis]|nr:ComF family protein [Algoriphagus machipongonensis]